MKTRTVAILMATVAPLPSWAIPIVLNPVDDGRVTPAFVTTTDYVIAGDGDFFGRGVMEFSTAGFSGDVQSALLSVNAYGMPLWSPTMRVYGYESVNGRVDVSDYSAGVLLGDWTLPQGLGGGQEAFFDVSLFLRDVRSPFVGFVLQGLFNPAIGSTGHNVLSSLEYNYGRPAQLTVNTASVPEPSGLAALAVGLLAMIGCGRPRPLKRGDRVIGLDSTAAHVSDGAEK